MKTIRTTITAVILAILLLYLTSAAIAKELIVVATDTTYESSLQWVDFLTLNEVPFKHVTPQEFENNKKDPYVVIIGGVDEPDGIKSLIKEILTEDEVKHISQKGNGEIYFKFQVWDPMQTVIVFAGSSRAEAESARKKNKKDWWNTFISWFDLEVEMEDAFHVY